MNEIELLTKYSNKHKKTIDKMAQELGIASRTLYRWYEGKAKPSPMARQKILSYVSNKS